MKRILKYVVIVAFGMIVLNACKPTENNYRQAYDAAKAKRDAANAEAMIPASGLLSDDGTSLKMVNGDSLFVSRDRLRREPGVTDSLQHYIIGVGVFKMNTNAKAQAAALREKGYEAHALMTTGDRWYTVAGSAATIEGAQNFIKDFKRNNPGYPYIGLPGAPVVIQK